MGFEYIYIYIPNKKFEKKLWKNSDELDCDYDFRLVLCFLDNTNPRRTLTKLGIEHLVFVITI